MRGRRGIVHDLGVLTAAQAAALLLNVAALVVIARKVGAHWFGVLQVGVAVSAYALIVAEWGLFSTGVRAVARLDRAADILAYARGHVGLLAALAGAVLLAGGALLPLFPFFAADPWVFVLYLLAVVPQVYMLDWIGVGLERVVAVGAAKLSRSLVYAVVVLLALSALDGRLGWPAWRWVPVVYLFSLFVGDAVIGAPVARWLGRPVLPRFPGWADWRQRLSVAGPIGGGIVIMRLLLNVDIVLLGVLATPAVVGGYAAASKLVFTFVVATEVLWNALLPRLARLWQGDMERFRARWNLYLALVLAGYLPAAAGGVAVARPLVAALYGDRFPEAPLVFQVLSLSYVLLSLAQFCGNTLIACDRQRAYIPPLLAGAGVAVAGNLLLVPRHGAQGACLAMLASHLTLLAGTGWLCRAYLARSLARPAAAALGGSLTMALAVARLEAWPLAARIAAGAGLYAILAGPWLWLWARRMLAEQPPAAGA